ncbi:MAG: Smr/MutS family protein [Bacteroidota bacterium]
MPRLHDDGARVRLDLHGLTVDAALDVAEATVEAALEAGRASVALIHGSSTSDPLQRNRTIKHALEAFFTAEDWPEVNGRLHQDDVLTLDLGVTRTPRANRLSLPDVFPAT